MGMKRFWAGLREMGLEKPRAAIALLPLSLFWFVFLLATLNADPDWKVAMGALALCYLTAFVALASQWFWARWFASGLGWSGAMVAAASLVMMPDWNPALATVLGIYGGLHVLIIVMLMGSKMAALYDMQSGWRQRYGMDEFGVIRLRKAVTRASAALPSLILWAFAPPNQEGGGLAITMAVLLTVVGLRGLVRLRTWGVLALGGAGAAVLVGSQRSAMVLSPHRLSGFPDFLATTVSSPGTAGALSLLLLAATLPFAGAAVRYYRALR
jgi:hypothetical protein